MCVLLNDETMLRCVGLAFSTGFCNVNVGICFWGGFFFPVMLLSIGIFPIFVRMLKSRKPFTPTNQRTARKYNVGNKIKYPCTNRVYALCLTPKIKCSNSAKAMQKELKRIHNGKNKHCSRHLSLSLFLLTSTWVNGGFFGLSHTPYVYQINRIETHVHSTQLNRNLFYLENIVWVDCMFNTVLYRMKERCVFATAVAK